MPRPKSAAGPLSSLSTRFDDKEMEVLKKAAEVKQWSVSQLIRAGAYEKAVNILNASGPGALSIRRLLGRVAEQLFDAHLQNFDYQADSYHRVPLERVFPGHAELEWAVSSLDPKSAADLVDALRKLGGELSILLSEEFARVQSSDSLEVHLIDPLLPSASTAPGATASHGTKPPKPQTAAKKSGKKDPRKAG